MTTATGFVVLFVFVGGRLSLGKTAKFRSAPGG